MKNENRDKPRCFQIINCDNQPASPDSTTLFSKVINYLRNPEDQKIATFENSPYYKGHDYFDQVLRAVTNKQPLCIICRKFDGTKNDEHILHPYFLKEYRGR